MTQCPPGAAGGVPISSLPPQQQAILAQQQRKLSFAPYYSSVGAILGVAGGNFTIAAGTEWVAFGYQLGQDAGVAGLPAASLGSNATYVETNLQQSGRTIGGTAVQVRGIAMQPFPDADPTLVKAIFANAHARIIFNGGENSYELGPLNYLAGANGLYGWAPSPVAGVDFQGNARSIGVQTNGLPGVENHLNAREGFTWWDQGADSDMNLVIKFVRSIVIAQPAAIAAVAPNQANLTPVQAFVPPTTLKAIFNIKLVGDIVGPRSMIS